MIAPRSVSHFTLQNHRLLRHRECSVVHPPGQCPVYTFIGSICNLTDLFSPTLVEPFSHHQLHKSRAPEPSTPRPRLLEVNPVQSGVDARLCPVRDSVVSSSRTPVCPLSPRLTVSGSNVPTTPPPSFFPPVRTGCLGPWGVGWE